MNNKLRITAFVPIKRHSERLKDKNFRLLAGRPLYHYIFSTLVQAPSLDSVYLYTSEPVDLFDLPKGVKYIEKDRDNNSPMSLIKEFCLKVESDLYLLAHATTPFTRVDTVERAVAEVVSGRHDSAFTVERINTFAWYGSKPINYTLSSVPRTQNIQPVLVETSGFYLFRGTLALNDSRRIGYSPFFCEVRFPETIDIDYPWQLDLANLCFEKME